MTSNSSRSPRPTPNCTAPAGVSRKPPAERISSARSTCAQRAPAKVAAVEMQDVEGEVGERIRQDRTVVPMMVVLLMVVPPGALSAPRSQGSRAPSPVNCVLL
jgi:hypothetical protein